MKRFTSSLAVLIPALAFAVVPVEEQPKQDLKPVFSKNLMQVVKKAASSSDNQNSFFEGFEGRNPEAYGMSANAWLPSGWSQFSRQGNKHVAYGAGYWDLTWLTLSNETTGSLPSNDQTTSFEGECFAYIMADCMWGDKKPYPDLGLDYATNHPQDEWLVSPTITPKAEEWLYFKLQFRPGWCLYNREASNFTSENSILEVYVTEGDGTTTSDWKKAWSLKDYIQQHYTEQELRADLVTFENPAYRPIYVSVSDYVGKNIKVAFRYYGVNGAGMALDNVALGIPMPKPSYTLPAGFFKQQSLTPTMQEITGTPQLLIPFGAEATWANTSEDILTQEWAYEGADKAKLTSEAYNLVSPAYTLGQHYEAPILTGKFESRSATYQTRYKDMQAGGRLHGTGTDGYNGELGIAYYDYLDPKGSIGQSTPYICFSNETNENWEMLLGRMPYTVDVQGMGCLFPATPQPYGFDYVDIFAQIVGDANGNLSPETALGVIVYRLPEDEYDENVEILGLGTLTGAQINELPDLEPGYFYKNLRFNLEVPVVAEGNLLVLVMPINIQDDDKLIFPFMKSDDENVWGNSVVYIYINDSEENGGSYDTFYNLNAFPMSRGHFAGLTMSLGASYSYMEAEGYNGETINIPAEGGEYTFSVHSMTTPDKWALTTNRYNKASWVTFQAAAVDNAEDLFDVTLNFAANTAAEARETELYLTQAGARVTLNVHQDGDNSGIADVAADAADMKVKVAGGLITVTGVNGIVDLYNATGIKVASIAVDGTATYNASHLSAGIYIARHGKTAAKIIL